MARLCAGHDKLVEPRKLAITTDRPGSISIDCGVNEDYLDERSGIYYKSDSEFVTAGLNNWVSPQYMLDHPRLGQMLKTLRSFPEGNKSCYHLKPEQGKGHHYMFRVFLFYGNYDGLKKPPKFELYLGVNFWATVELDIAHSYQFFEIIQFLSTDTIDVCLVNTGSGIPIISGLELRLLNDSIYQIESKALQLELRYDVMPDDYYSPSRVLLQGLSQRLKVPLLSKLDRYHTRAVLLVLAFALLSKGYAQDASALVPAIITFGHSAVDAANHDYLPNLFKANYPPYGKDFINHKPTGRFRNGKLATDITAENLGFKTYAPAYLSPAASGKNLLIGATFASVASNYDDKDAIINHAVPLSQQLEYDKEY
ncbi:hypothetical protein SLE2022_384150 [Rubroshorea leprosula]